MSNNNDFLYEDSYREVKQDGREEFRSRYCDFVYYTSSINPSLKLAVRVLKPEKPSYILATTHGWHMSIPKFQEYSEAQSEYLRVEVDMRGRAFSDGSADCNGYELIDVIDAVEFVKKNYAEYIIDPETVYFSAGSGGGGNAFAIACKFPDYFAHVTSSCGISDYAMWYEGDKVGEFQDELCVWIGDIKNKEAYASRSGADLVKNLYVPMAVAHGVNDIRVPITQSRKFKEEAKKIGKGDLVKMIEFEGVGGWDHWDKLTDEQRIERDDFIENDRKERSVKVEIPKKGQMLVGGYLYTKYFEVMLKCKDRCVTLNYDIENKTATINELSSDEYDFKWRD